MDRAAPSAVVRTNVVIALGPLRLQGILDQPHAPHGIVLFAHGSGSGRLSPRNQFVASVLQQDGFATLLFDLLTVDEEHAERFTRHLRFDIALLADRLSGATRWAIEQPVLAPLPIGYLGASTGAGAALVAAAVAAWSNVYEVGAVVSRGGRPDLAGAALPRVHAPTLLIVGGDDTEVIALNRRALAQLRSEKELRIVPGAGHLFEEPGTLETAARLAADWFQRHLHATRTAA
ncbi:alpha/beta family hydrolase [Lysobacter sp. CFH 32150]|uniref:dienelactone hydrolase family protein n=1 Tax=Lysobacter sp. CFH 32150 TaxID=2927128 RepID=UPI001FA6BF9E|nr:alpha/beta family hydrolase [Lysobacter sp. CFH 32150]MCI4566556.1 dienelactone hydrolase family protein [Lysobacter sp. CFH 32150]